MLPWKTRAICFNDVIVIRRVQTGTDSRIGFGYRLGEHADFQVQFELGPQKETQAIGSGSTNKRAISSADSFKVERDAERQALREKVCVWINKVI